jgi:aconitate hydratase
MFTDLVALLEAVIQRGGLASLVRPKIPCDIVIDHSIQVDYAGTADAKAMNEQLEFSRNSERYAFLKWVARTFLGVRLVPPGVGIIHQVNLEYLASVVFTSEANRAYCRKPTNN